MLNEELGNLITDTGGIVCFSLENVIRLSKKLGISEDALIQRYEGVKCEFEDGGIYGVDILKAVNNDGSTHPVVMIGADPEKFIRFLGGDEQTFDDFYKSHHRYGEVGIGDQFNSELFEIIADEYRFQLLN